jgi:predicted SnoaL-like aldol condensation-catalyzing enzyme
MNNQKNRLVGFVLSTALLASGLVMAQQTAPPPQPSNPTPGCSATPAQLDANKKVVMEFFRTAGEARVALADTSYKQHNPVFKKRGTDDNISDYEEFKKTFIAQAARPAAPGATDAGPQPPQGNPYEVVTAECDIVTVVHKVYRQDPTAAPGKFYEAFTFDTFRVAKGKLVEHWDGALIAAPAALP